MGPFSPTEIGHVTYSNGDSRSEVRLDTVTLSGLIAAPSKPVAFCFSQNRLYRFNTNKWDTLLLSGVSDMSFLSMAREDGEVIYIAENNTVHKITNATSDIVDRVTRNLSFTPVRMVMINENTGYALDDNGRIYFTNNGFENTEQESIPGNVQIQYLILAADGETLFAYRDGSIFRY